MDGGARCLQIRAKELPSGAFLDLCDTITGTAAPYDAAVIVNDRPDLAVMSRAAGVHVGQDDLPPSRARGLLGVDAVVGLSTHTPAQVEAALREPITYLAIGPVFATRTKDTGYQAVGLEFVSAVVRIAGSVPVVAIGGITLENAPSVIAAGAAAVAVIGDLLTVPDVRGRTRDYLQALVQHRV
jgi:thiamine-phosphate pyrophosphorylase